MLINDEEEKKKRLEEAMQITNSINSNNYQDDFSTNNNSFDDEYSQRLQEAMSITNSINPINYDEEPSFDIDATPDMDISTINENKQVGYDDEQKNNNANISDKISYIGKRISSGMVGGITGIAQAALTDTANNMQKGKNKPIVTSILNSVNSIINPMSSSMQNVLESQRESIEIIKDKDKSLLQKFVNLLTKASSDSIDTMLPSKKAIAQTAGNIVPGIDNAVLNLNEQISTPIYNWKNKLYEEGQNYGAITNTLGNVGEAVGNMIPSITGTMVTGSPTVGLATMGISAKGQSTQEALERGADLNEAVRIGDTKGMVEIGTEMLTGGVNIFGRGALDDITDGIVNNVSNNVARFFVKQGFDVAGENLEETISDIVGTIIDKGTVDPDASYSIKDWQKTTLETTLTTFALNILTGGLINDIHNIKNDNNLNETKTEIDVSDIKPFFVLNKNADGKINNINYVNGVEIDNPNKDVNIKPAIIKNNETNRYNVIDTETGILLDTTPYESIQSAELGFKNNILDLSENQINDINKEITETQITLYQGIDKLISEGRNINTIQNQQNDTIEQNNIQGQEINNQNNKIAQNGISEQINNSQFYHNKTEYQVSNIAEIENALGKNKTYTLEEISDKWSDIMEDTYDLTLQDDKYVSLDADKGSLEAVLYDGETDDVIKIAEIQPNKNGKYSSKKISNAIKDVSILIDENKPIKGQVDIEGNEVRYMKKGKNVNQERGNTNVRAEKIRNDNSQQETYRAEKGKNTRGEKEISRSNGSSQEKLSKSIQQFQREQQKQLGKDTKISLTEQNKLTKTERTIQKEFENITGLNYGVYESNKGAEDAVYVNNDILVKHNSLQSKKKSNFLPFHELGHWFKVNRSTEWTAIHDIIDNTITKNQIEEYKNVLKDQSMFENMSEAEIRDYIIEEIESDYFGNWANDISNWADMIRNKMLSDDYVQLLIDISDENISTHYNIFGTQEQQEQVYGKINEMMNNFITENKNTFKNDFDNNVRYSGRNEGNKVDINAGKVYNRITDQERRQVQKEVIENQKRFSDGIGFIHLSKNGYYSYSFIKDGYDVEVLQKFKGNEEFIEKAKEVVLDEFNRKPQGLNYAIKRIRSRLTNSISNNASNRGRQKSSKDSQKSVGDGQQQRRDNSSKNIQNNNRNVKKSDRTLFDRNNQDIYYNYSEEEKGKNTSTYSNAKMRELIQANDIKQIDNKKQFIRTVIEREGNSYWGNMFKDSTLRDAKYKNEIIKSYLEKQNENNIISTDSEGRELSKEQQEYFKDSKVRDENGNLLVLHHGTDADFNIFEHKYIGEDNKDGLGFYFTSNNLQFEYENPKTVYANIINPATEGKMIDKIIKREEELFETIKDKKQILSQIQKEFGVDGIMDKNRGNIVAFNSEQIKNIDNKTPTTNPDTRYSNRYDTEENGEGGFYSQLEKVIEEKMPNTSNVQQIKGIIENSGIKQDEIKWIGLDDYLKQHSLEKISKQQLLDYIKANQINIVTVQKENRNLEKLTDLFDELGQTEIQLSSAEDEYGEYTDYEDEVGAPKYKQYTLDGGTNYQEILYTLPYEQNGNDVKNLQIANVDEYNSPHWEENNVLAHARTQDFEDTSGNKVLFIDEIQSDLHQEGRKKGYSAKNDIDTLNKLKKQLDDLNNTYAIYEDEAHGLSNKGFAAARNYYTEQHNKAVENIAHLEETYKINSKLTKEQQYELLDYEDKITQQLLLANRYDNFGDNIESEPYMMTKIKEAEENLDLSLPKEILEKQPQQTIYRKLALENFKENYYDYGNISNLVWGKWVKKYLSLEDQKRYDFLDNETDKLINQRNQLLDEIDRFNKGIPDVFPFKKNWHEFVLRRMINNAVEQGYDEVAWTTGRQQRERYNLSKVIDYIEYQKFYDHPNDVDIGKVGNVEIVAYKDGNNVFDRQVRAEDLADYIGKDLSTRILTSKEGKGTISNLDEEIRVNGNSGMYLFYDQEIPSYLNKYLKKWNSKVEEITLQDADGKIESKQMGFKITDEMRNSIKQNGQPLFSNRKLDDEESSTYDERIQRKNRELIKELREQKESIQGLEGYSRTEIKDIVSNYIQDKLVENDLEDISINGAEIIGSRNRGNAKTNSDLDLVVEYSGDIREDDLFNILNEEPLEIEGIKVDINPITADNTGTLEEYLERSKQYDREVLNATSKETIRKEDPNVAPGATNAQGANRFIEQEIRKIEASGNWDNSIPVTKLTDIRKTIEDYLGLGIKKGHFRERAYGIYKEGRDVIRGKELKDIDNILHETGHALDLGNRLKIDKESIANELLTAIQKHGGYENETRSTKLDEGFAEVIRTYSIIPEQAKTDYPQSVAVLEEIRKADKSFDDFIRKVQQQTYNYIHQNPQNRVHSNISIGESNRTPLTKAWLEQEVMRNIWDKDYAVKKVVSEIAKIGGKTTNQIKASNNAYYLTRLATGIHDKVTSMLSDGYINEKGEKIMPGLNKVGEILGDDPQRYNDLRDYLVARRDTDYKAKTLKTGIRDMDTKYVLEKFANDTQIKDAAQVVYDTLDGVMQYAVDNGLISEEDVQSLKESNAFYVPMQRVIEGRGNQLGRKGAVSDIIKARTGSELDIKDVLENIVSNSTNIIQQVENNNVLKALYNQGEEAGLTGSIYDVIPAPMMKVGTANLSMWENELKKQGVNTTKIDLEKTVDIFAPNNKIDTKNLITSFIDTNGNRVYLQFNDEILFNSLMNLDKKMMSNVLKINRKLNMPLRYGATMANIGFAIPNMISDTAQAAIFSNAGFIPVVDNALGVLDILTATNKHVRNFVKNYSPKYVNRIENMYNLYIQSGATNSTRMSQFRDSTQSNMKDIYGTKNSETLGIHEKWKPLKRLLDIMTYIPEISEQSTRFRVFERNYDMYKSKGNSEMDARILAALESRDATQDFGRTGNLTREINQLIPFSAARVGSSYTFFEKVKANPKRTAMRIAILSAIALAIKAIGYDDKEIEELNQRKKDDNFVLRVGDNVVTIKKPQGLLRSIVNLTEYIEDLATGHIEDGKEGERLGEWINNAIMDNAPADSVTGLVPNMVAPLIENAINKDLYYNTDIVKSYDLDLPDSQQYYEYNSQLAILLGKVFNYSPAKIDNLISGYFAGLGTQVTNIMDYASGKLGITAQKAEMGAESNAVGKRFIVNVNSNSASVDEIYNRKTELTKKKNGGTITSEEETELSNLTAAITNMSKVNKQIKEIKKDLNMSGKEKAEQIKELQKQRTDIARQALGKDLLDDTNSEKIETTSFYPTNSSLSLNKMTLELTPEMKEEYSKLASEFYKKYEKQGLYSEDKLKQIKTKAKDYAKKTLMQKYKSQLMKSK